MEIYRANGINLVANNDIKMPNCTDTSWTVDNLKKDISIAITRGKTHLNYVHYNFYPLYRCQAEVFPRGMVIAESRPDHIKSYRDGFKKMLFFLFRVKAKS